MGTSGKRLDESTRARIQRELKEGLSRRNVARRNYVAKRTVDKEAKRLAE